MNSIIQIIPNYSEGRNKDVMDQIIAPFQRDGIHLCTLEMDPSYHRSVVTVIGEVDAVFSAAIASVKIACELIDLRVHQGEHKRMGSCDVLPLLPISNITQEELISRSECLAEELSRVCDLPVFLYALSARRPQCASLPDIRKGEFEGMGVKLQEEQWHPDFGEPVVHPSAGVIAVGVRKPLIAFNIDLNTKEEKVAKEIAKAIRFSSGGYRFVQAGSVYVAEKECYQVSMNVTDYTKTSLYRAFEAVKMEAKRFDVSVVGSEIIGLVSQECLLDSLAYYLKKASKEELRSLCLEEIVNLAIEHLQLVGFDQKKVIEYYVQTSSH